MIQWLFQKKNISEKKKILRPAGWDYFTSPGPQETIFYLRVALFHYAKEEKAPWLSNKTSVYTLSLKVTWFGISITASPLKLHFQILCFFPFQPQIPPVPSECCVCNNYIHQTDLADVSSVFWQNFQIPCDFPWHRFFWAIFPVQWGPCPYYGGGGGFIGFQEILPLQKQKQKGGGGGGGGEKLLKGRREKLYPVLKGVRGANSFGPAIFQFCSPTCQPLVCWQNDIKSYELAETERLHRGLQFCSPPPRNIDVWCDDRSSVLKWHNTQVSGHAGQKLSNWKYNWN